MVPLGHTVGNKNTHSLRLWASLIWKKYLSKLGIFAKLNLLRIFESSGAGGIRTLVQTRCVTAFYMFSFCLDFREIAGQKLPTHSLSQLEFLGSVWAPFPIGLLLRSHEIERRKPRPSSDFLHARLTGRGISYYNSDYAARA